MQHQLVAKVPPPNFPQHFHADHPVFSCSESEQKQLYTWVSFQPAATRLGMEAYALAKLPAGGLHSMNCCYGVMYKLYSNKKF
jgi:hypothetical protein